MTATNRYGFGRYSKITSTMLVVVVAALPVYAENTDPFHPVAANQDNAFFEKGLVTDMWAPPKAMLPAAEIESFPRRHSIEELFPEKKEQGKGEEETKQPSAEESIVAKYGDPTKDAAITPIDSAPKPFKGMIEALSNGNDKLAYEYAKQYVRHMRNLQKNSARVGSLVNAAMIKEGMLEGGEKAAESSFFEDRKLLEDDIQKSRPAGMDEASQEVLSEQVRGLFDKAVDESKVHESNAIDSESATTRMPRKESLQEMQPFDEKRERLKIRTANAKRVPYEPSGQVQVNVFAYLNDFEALRLGSEIEKLHQLYKADPRVRVTLFTLDSARPESVKTFRQRTNATYAIVDGQKLAKSLSIMKSPLTLIMGVTTGKPISEEGVRKAYYFDELIKLMQGRA